jgi:hypothetical protein
MTLQIGNLARQIPCWWWIGSTTGAEHYFDVSKGFGDSITQPFQFSNLNSLNVGAIINSITYYLVPTNAVTYRLRVYKNTTDGTAINAATHILFEGAAAKAGSTLYIEPNQTGAGAYLNIPAVTLFGLYYGVEWTGAPGNTTGMIYVKGISYNQSGT